MSRLQRLHSAAWNCIRTPPLGPGLVRDHYRRLNVGTLRCVYPRLLAAVPKTKSPPLKLSVGLLVRDLHV